MILLIDNYDSFTYNLYHQVAAYGYSVKIVRNDAVTIEDIKRLAPEAIIISPGPGTPSEAGISIEVIQAFYKEIPILGVCLGHQAIGEAFGAEILRAKRVMHGKTAKLHFIPEGLFEEIEGNFEVMRYHSLVISKQSLPHELLISAISQDDDEIMAVHHAQYPVFGVQFHPESIGTVRGNELIEAFIKYVPLKVEA